MSVSGNIRRAWWLAAGVVVLGLASAAGADDGPYIQFDVGVAFQADSDLRVNLGDNSVFLYGQAYGSVAYNTGWLLDGAAGWRISDYRVELNGSYSANAAERLRLGPIDVATPGGIQIVGAMVNAYYDMPLSDRIKPYIGGGLGAAYMTFETNTILLGSGFYVDDNDTQFAFNIMAGVGYGLTDHLVLNCGYRYYQTAVATFESLDINPNFPFTRLHLSVQRHDLTAGVRYEF